jgi:hypothetical protein
MRGAYRIRITPAEVGQRVSVRARLADPPAQGPTTTDTLGILRRWADGVLAIERADGTVTEVAEADLLAARLIPPPPPPRPRRRYT